MGKDKEKQKSFRSRQQPASSSQAAALLAGQPGEFIGFSSFSPMIDLEQHLPGEYSLCFKKMNKKDTITKVKALNEFAQLLTSAPLTTADEHKILLQNWVSSYTKLSTDSSRQVREAAQQGMGKVAVVVKKLLGPHLKTLLPYWLAARFDPSREVARAAVEALQQAIPPHKHTEALKFVGKDILAQCKEAFTQTAQSFSDAKTSPEMAQERYERVISTFMMAISYLSETLTPEDNVTFAEQYKALFLDANFWKFLSNKAPTIRRAAYNLVPVVARLSKQIPDFDIAPIIAKEVLGLFSDKEPTTHQAMWDAILALCTSIPQVWELPSVDIRKHVFPRLFAFLRAGTNGSLTYPSLLPFLSVIPATQRNAGFYSQFFGNMWQGFASEGITKQGRQAAQALLLAYLECISFAASNNQTNNLTPEEKTETDTYIFQEGIWHVLNHYLSAELLLYNDEFFVESFCKYAVKLLASSNEGSTKFWKKFSELTETHLTSVPHIFCPRVAALLYGLAKASVPVPADFQRALFAQVSQSASFSKDHLELATTLVEIWPVSSLGTSDAELWSTKLLPWFTEWLSSSQPKEAIRALLGLIATYLIKSENRDEEWNALIQTLVTYFKDTHEFILLILEKVTRNGDVAKWRSTHLDSLAVPLLIGGDLHSIIEPQASSHFLVSLISSGVLDRKILKELGTGLMAYLGSKPPTSPPPWGLDVIKAIVGVSALAAPESVDLELVSDLLVTFLGYVLHARDDTVLATWQDCMRVGKQLEATQSIQIRKRLLSRLRDYVSGDTELRFNPSTGFKPDAERWTEELVVCNVAAREIADGFPIGEALDALVRKDEWIAASLTASNALAPNYIDTRLSPILPQATRPAADVEPFLKLSLFSLAFIRALGLPAILAHGSNLWIAAQIELVQLVANALPGDSAPAWWEGAQRLNEAVNETSEANALAAHADAVLDLCAELAQQHGGVYLFVLEKVAEKVANEWNKDSALEVFVKHVLCLEMEAMDNDVALTRIQAVLPHIIPHLEHPLQALTDMRMKYIQALQDSTDFKRTTRILEVLPCLNTTYCPLSKVEVLLILAFFSRFSRAPLKSQDPDFTAKRLDIALCKVLVSVIKLAQFTDIDVEAWKLLKMRSLDWIKVPTTDPISVLLLYQAAKLFAELDTVFTAQAETEQVKELDWTAGRLEVQQVMAAHLINAGSATTTQSTIRLLSLAAHIFRDLPDTLVQPHASKLYGLLQHTNTDVQKWAHQHLLAVVSVPVPEASTPALAAEHQQLLNDTSTWEHIFEADDATLIRLDANKTVTTEKVFGHLLAWDILVTFLAANNTQVRSHISSTYLREGSPSPISVLLQNLFKYIHDYSDKGKNAAYLAAVHHFRVSDIVSVSGRDIAVMCGALYTRLLQCIPGVVRLWWTDDCEKKMATFVDTYTTTHASPVIIEKELGLVNRHTITNKDPDFTVYTISRTREVVATYRKDEMVVEIVLTLAPNYPLRACSVAANQHLNVGEGLWRKWLLGMTTLLLTSEGDLLDACLLWKNSLDQHFEGVEVCPICYSLFNSGQLPKLQCRTCKNKFHSTCMYKWFSSSHKSTCPLCQTDFQSV